MSSKTQLNEYLISLKKEIVTLKNQKLQLAIRVSSLKIDIENLEYYLQISKSKERKWYHFF